ncbi:hypothetical protein BS50DRAFT_636603 [Corynespora cassiicola Philippines]|uniref:Uncharacterized protein n=1 Tax=Corynespora cassiicola Philippines TaxID=1448308 RepID=A0A2T2NG52_CORCC|nr:hypothetical protein BS50DRAFT_636603 [Corynespora cassiicola Philippines]
MDYQTFNSQQHLPPSFGGPFSTSSAAHLAQPTHSPQQQQLYADPHARLQQSNPSPSPYGQFTNGQAGGFPSSMGGNASFSGAMMQPGGLSHNQLHQARAAALQQQQHQQQQQHLSSPSPYSSAPFQQGLVSPAHQQFVQNRQTASPSSAGNTAYATPQPQPQRSPSLVPSNSQTPMNPPANQPQAQQPAQVQTPVKAVPQSPVSPVAQAREKERMTTLLEINNLLIKEVVDLQSQGKAGHIGPSPDGKSEGDKQQPSKEFVEYMRRLQSNLAFLAQNAEKNHKPNQAIQPGPAIMTIPSSPPELAELYSKLQGLYPGWKGQAAQMKASPGPQRLNSTSSQPGMQNHMQPPNSAGLQNNMPNSAGLMPNNAQLPSNMNAMGNMGMNMNMNMNMNNMNPAMQGMQNMQQLQSQQQQQQHHLPTQ